MKDGVRFPFCDSIAGITYPSWNRSNFISAINAINRCNFNIGILQYTVYYIPFTKHIFMKFIVLKFNKSFFPYIMGMIVIAMYFLQVSWRFTSLNQLVNILTYVIEGLEEALREIISFIIRDENRPGRANSVKPKTYAGT